MARRRVRGGLRLLLVLLLAAPASAEGVEGQPSPADKLHASLLVLPLLPVLACLALRPRATAAAALLWGLLWAVWAVEELAKGRDVLSLARERTDRAAETLQAAAVALWSLAVAWLQLAFPLYKDLCRALSWLLAQLLGAAVRFGQRLTWEDVVLFLLFCVFVYGVWVVLQHCIMGARAFRSKVEETKKKAGEIRCCGACRGWCARQGDRAAGFCQELRRVLPTALFHLSFLVVGYLSWWTLRELPSWSSSIVWFFQCPLPFAESLRAFFALQRHKRKRERERLERSAKARPARPSLWGIFVSQEPGSQDSSALVERDAEQDVLDSKVRVWLQFWACWPFLNTLSVLRDAVPEQQSSSFDGLVLDLTLLLQWWGWSLLAPYMISFCGTLTTKLADLLRMVSSKLSARSAVTAVNVAGQSRSWLVSLGEAWGPRLVAAAAAVMVVYLLWQVVSIVSWVLTYLLLWIVAADCAAKVAGKSPECVTRLAFWILLMAWMVLSSIPVLSVFLMMWTPLAAAFAFVVGEWVLDQSIDFTLDAVASCLDCLSRPSPGPPGPRESPRGPAEPLLAEAEAEAAAGVGRGGPDSEPAPQPPPGAEGSDVEAPCER
ncbi:unnamed protein product [Prorocentrum cordatum]|uniref:Glycerophosphocholine acyltransferase 1 n=1 Tax=Prorocentrum cordatum TaxID=2364126 RepID=A0ABN9SLY9_9DINO|nr:unnamed protein product [Polarella glacialis]